MLDANITLNLGDMRRPCCGLCQKLGSLCTFPVRKKPRRGPSSSTRASQDNSRPPHISGSGTIDRGGSPAPAPKRPSCAWSRESPLHASFCRGLGSNFEAEGIQEWFLSEIFAPSLFFLSALLTWLWRCQSATRRRTCQKLSEPTGFWHSGRCPRSVSDQCHRVVAESRKERPQKR